LYNPSEKYYATVAAPATLEGMLDYARESLDIVAPAGDLVYSNAFDIPMQDVTTGFVVGKSMVDGVHCDHLAFRNADTDWQFWVEVGKSPIPRKLVITSKTVNNAPQYTLRVKGWKTGITPAANAFVFAPPAGAIRLSADVLIGQNMAIQAAKNFRVLRSLGITVRKIIDTVIATRCIESGLPLLYSDRDFDPFVEHLGLRSALPGT
jgi:hypothetical protein